MAHALAARRRFQHPHCLPLVIAGEDRRLGLHLAPFLVSPFVALNVDEPGQEVEEAIPLEHVLP